MKNILVPVDFSRNATNALKYALQFANQAGCNVTLIHCTHLLRAPFRYKEEIESIVKKDLNTKKASLKKLADKTVAALKINRRKLKVNLRVTSGIFVAEEIIAAAKKEKSFLIIMGTHGATGLERVLLGSITSRVISQTKIPVLAIPGKFRFKKIEKIVYATDLENLQRELKILLPVAGIQKAAVEVLFFDYGYDIETNFTELFQKKTKGINYRNLRFVLKKATLAKPLKTYLDSYLRKEKADILAMFTHEKTFLDKLLLRSNTESIAFQVKRPLLAMNK